MHENDNTISTCPVIANQIAKVSLPVSTRPFAVTGPVTVECHGRPTVSEPETDDCGRHSCRFIISQRLKISVPVEFGANVKIGESSFECERATIEYEV